jgi:hypothetical protein
MARRSATNRDIEALRAIAAAGGSMMAASRAGRAYARAQLTTATNSSPRSVARRMKSLRPSSAISVISSTKVSSAARARAHIDY